MESRALLPIERLLESKVIHFPLPGRASGEQWFTSLRIMNLVSVLDLDNIARFDPQTAGHPRKRMRRMLARPERQGTNRGDRPLADTRQCRYYISLNDVNFRTSPKEGADVRLDGKAARCLTVKSAGPMLSPRVPPAPDETVVGRGGLEPPTSRLSGVRSNHLSYRPS